MRQIADGAAALWRGPGETIPSAETAIGCGGATIGRGDRRQALRGILAYRAGLLDEIGNFCDARSRIVGSGESMLWAKHAAKALAWVPVS
jgi:hypothetical protein